MRVCGVEIKHNDAMICLLEKKDGLFHLPDCRARRLTLTNVDSRDALVSFQATFKKLLEDYGVTHVAIRERQKVGKHAGTPLSFKLEAALELITSANLQPADIDLIVSAGQTIWHEVRDDGRVAATLQIGESSVIAERTGITSIGNLRARDVAAGGQGAPLVSYFDWLLLRHPTRWRAAQNIGGIGNVTFLPPQNDPQLRALAFDTGPGNVLIDCVVSTLTGGAETYDRDAAFAQQGQIDELWLVELLQHPYYARTPPKTTGRELFSPAMANALLTQGRGRGLDAPSIVATLTALTADSIANAYNRFAPASPAEAVHID